MAEDKKTEANEATETADLYHRHGDPDSSVWDEAVAVTGRRNDLGPGEKVTNTNFADRAKAAKKTSAKQVADAENKSVSSAESKQPAKRASKRAAK